MHMIQKFLFYILEFHASQKDTNKLKRRESNEEQIKGNRINTLTIAKRCPWAEIREPANSRTADV